MSFESLLKGIAQKDIVLPYLELAMMSDKWPDHYTVDIDSSPYYGLTETGEPDGYFHPSTHPLCPPRQLYYMMHPEHRSQMVRERNTTTSAMTLSMGSALHGIVQTQLQMIGLLVPEKTEVEYILHEHHVRGKIDFILDLPDGEKNLVGEMKTQNSFGFKKQEKVKPEWDAQLSLAEYSQNADHGVLILVEAGWPYSLREFAHKRNDNLLDEIFDKFSLVHQAIESNEPPRHCCAEGSEEMQACQARYSCWLKP